ncbi:TonB family protein [Rhizobium lemnae]|uniref:TonB family protein n=1 Tax=Rhizobium lemnae TaxID=1214924 RepID=A0ABV8E8D2_9HYPH|nr:TonB family protein [Rhizobium lemnae]MCJ8507653.1 TonB family protein [Rhizobium lemnae]
MMTSTAGRWKRRLGEAALWTGAGSLVLTAHLAAAAVLLRHEPEESGDLAPPAAIMIELAAVPEAAATEETVVSEDTQDSLEVKTEQSEPVEQAELTPDAQPVPKPEPPQIEEKAEPVQETTQTIPQEILEPVEQPVEQQLTIFEHAEVPLPTARPSPVTPRPVVAQKPEPKPEKKVEQRQPKPQPPAAKAAVQAKADVQESTRTAAAATSSTTGTSSVSPAKWQAKLAAHLARQRGKCPANGRGSTAYVSFRIDGGGNLSAVSLARSSGFGDFDDYIVDLVRRASPVPPPPSGIGNKVTVPIGYRNC